MARRPSCWLVPLFRFATPAPIQSRIPRSQLKLLTLENRITPTGDFTGPLKPGQLQDLVSLGLTAYEHFAEIPDAPAGVVSYLPLIASNAFALDTPQLQKLLSQAPEEYSPKPITLALPKPDGSFERFHVWEAAIMAPGLQAHFPTFHTYRGQGIDDPAANLAISMTSLGFQTQVLSPNGNWYIDPYYHLNDSVYVSYFKQDMVNPHDGGCQCALCQESIVASQSDLSDDLVTELNRDTTTSGRTDKGTATADTSVPVRYGPNTSYGGNLRTFRTAVAATVEYTTFHGDSVINGQAAIVASINRVSGVYEREISVRLQLVANNSNLVYTTATGDNYTNNNGSTMLAENQSNIDAVIGSANYDLGHVFSTGGGGIAGLGVVGINGQKARGVTGRSAPVGDAFDIDYVAHEMGHQFDGNHTFNASASGNRNASTAYEPGSGSTIQAYAGIVAGNNIQSNSDVYFHAISLGEIITNLNSLSTTIGPPVANGNIAPVANAGADYVIPTSTPFALTGAGSDANGDALTYTWEQYDLGPIVTYGAFDTTAPLFRSVTGTTNPTRTFPTLANLLNNTSDNNEVMPTGARNLNFNLTVRDNRSGGGGIDMDEMLVTVVNTGAAFTVTAPNTAVSWAGGSTQNVTWNVSGTDAAPISTSLVNILLSTDGGNTFPTTILANTPNDGSESITVPNVVASQARIKVQPVGNIYFDVSNANFTIVAGTTMNVTGMTPANNALVTAPSFKIDLTFSQPVNAATISTADLNVSAGSVTAAVLQSANTVRYTINGLTAEGPVSVTLLNNALAGTTDGQTNLASTFNFTADAPTQAIVTPLTRLNPAGSLVYSGTATGLINLAGDADAFTIALEAGQTVSAIVTPAGTLTPRVTVTGPMSTNATASSPGAGQVVFLNSTPVAVGGTYTFTVDGLASTVGTYTMQILLNAAVEKEANGGANNSTPATAEALALTSLGSNSALAAVRGSFPGATASAGTEAEPNNTTATATNIGTSFSTYSGNLYQFSFNSTIGATGDIDYYSLGAMQVGDIISVSMTGAGAGTGSLTDSLLQLRRLGGTNASLVADDDGGVGTNIGDSLIFRYVVATADTYVIRATQTGSSTSGTYQIGVNLENTGTVPLTGGNTYTETEDNGTRTTANAFSDSWRAVTHSTTATGTISSASDVDLFAYTFTAGDFVTLNARSTSALDAKIRLLNSAGSALIIEDGTSAGTTSGSTSTGPGANSPLYSYRIPTWGTYYVEVAAASGTGTYALDAFLSTTTTPPAPTPFDYYTLPLISGQTLALGVKADAATTVSLDITDAAGTVLASGTGPTTNYDSFLNAFTAPSAGTYYVRISGNTTAAYTLLAATGTTLDNEPNDTFATAQDWSATSRVLGNSSTGDDWYIFTGIAGTTLTLATTTPGDAVGEFTNTLNPKIELYKPDGSLLASDSNSAADGRNAMLTVPLTLTGSYEVRITSESATSGEYTLTRSTVTTPIATVSGFTVNGGDTQRSRITTVTLNFTGNVLAADFNTAGAIQFKRTGVSSSPTGAVDDLVQTGPAGIAHITVTQGTTTSLVLTFDNNGLFSNSNSYGVESGSLTDGYWQIICGSYTSALNDLNLRRLYGDFTVEANGTVNGADLDAFGNFFGTASVTFDFNNDGTINGADLDAFGNHFANTL
ncbi:hypothetical protein BH11PLA2_BH11PLA2_25720 [soil metagenome]